MVVRIVVVLKSIVILLLASRAQSRPGLSRVRQTRVAVFGPDGEVWNVVNEPFRAWPAYHSVRFSGDMAGYIVGILSDDLSNERLIVTTIDMQAIRNKIKDFTGNLPC